MRRLTVDALAQKLIIRARPAPWIYSGLSYRDGAVRALIRANKFYGDSRARDILAVLISDMMLSILEERSMDREWRTALIIPIPSSSARRGKRGYNQVERFLEPALERAGLNERYAPRALVRTERQSQIRVEKKRRAQNIKNAFSVPHAAKPLVHGSCCILVDDVSETGSTLIDARRALLKAGAREVIGIAVAH